jgi:hypothetical protein
MGYGLDGGGSILGKDKIFLFRRLKLQKSEADRSSSSTAEDNNDGAILHFPTRLQGMVLS